MSEIVQMVRASLPQAYGVIGGGLIGIVGAIVAIVRGRDKDLGAPVGALAILTIIMAVGVAEARAVVFAPVGDDPSMLATNLVHGVSLQMNLTSIGLTLALSIVLLLGFAARRHGLISFSLAAPLALAIGCALSFQLALTQSFAQVAGIGPGNKTDVLRNEILEALAQTTHGKRLVIGLGVVGLLAAAIRARRASQSISTNALAAAGALFGVGVVAFITTRAHAADREPLTVVDRGVIRPAPFEAPRFTTCAHSVPAAPLLTFAANGAHLDGRPIDAATLADQLITVKHNFKLLHPNEEFLGTLLILAPANASLPSLLPVLRAAHGASFTNLQLVAINPRVVETATVGPIDRRETCAIPFQLVESGGVAAEAIGSWGALAAAPQNLKL